MVGTCTPASKLYFSNFDDGSIGSNFGSCDFFCCSWYSGVSILGRLQEKLSEML